MADDRPTMRQLREQKIREGRAEMKVAIAEGRLTVRQMSPQERKVADRQRAAGAKRRAARIPR
jgi:hypothetical protein